MKIDFKKIISKFSFKKRVSEPSLFVIFKDRYFDWKVLVVLFGVLMLCSFIITSAVFLDLSNEELFVTEPSELPTKKVDQQKLDGIYEEIVLKEQRHKDLINTPIQINDISR